MEKFGRAGLRQGESPADALLTSLGQMNHSIVSLFMSLSRVKNYKVWTDSAWDIFWSRVATNGLGTELNRTERMELGIIFDANNFTWDSSFFLESFYF